MRIMRTIVDIPEKDLAALRRIQQRRAASRATLIREAVAALISNEEQQPFSDKPAFGLWRDRGKDGIAYQQDARSEWAP